MPIPTTLSIRRPDDWHVHLRDGPMLAACAVHTARQFARAIIMPNLVPPVTKVAESPMVMLVPSTSRFKSPQELSDFAAKKPGGWNDGAGGRGSRACAGM